MMKVINTIFFLIVMSFQVYAQVLQVSRPEGLKANFRNEGGDRYIDLSWDKKQEGDTLTESYYVYQSFPPKEKLFLNGAINRLNVTNCEIEVKNTYAAEYFFAIQAVSSYKYKLKSELGDTLKVLVPSIKLPMPSIKESKLDGQKLSLAWEYESILDLKEFHLEVENNSYVFNATDRKCEVKLEDFKGEAVIIKLKAISESGVESSLLKYFVKKVIIK